MYALSLTKKEVYSLSKINLSQLYQEGIQAIFADTASWQKFLTFSSQIHKYSFVEKVQIYQQNPDVRYLADFDTWQKINRFVRRNEKGIAISQLGTDAYKRSYVFDLSQTYGKKFSEPEWHLSKEDAQTVIRQFYQSTFNVSQEEVLEMYGLEEVIAKGIQFYQEKDSSGILQNYQYLIEDSVYYSLGNKLEWIPLREMDHDISSFDLTLSEISMIGQITSEVTKHALQKISVLMQELILNKQKEEQQYEQTSNNQRNGSSRSRNDRSRQSTAERVRKNRDELPTRKQSASDSRENGRQQLDDLSTRERTVGIGLRIRNVSDIEREESSTRNRQHIERGTTHETVIESSERIDDQRTDSNTTSQYSTVERQSLPRLTGEFSSLRNLSFTWYENNTLRLSTQITQLNTNTAYPTYSKSDIIFSIKEEKDSEKLFSIVQSREIMTNDVTRLREIFEQALLQDNPIVEKEIFQQLKTQFQSTNHILQDNELLEYRQYLNYLNQEIVDSNELKMITFANNPHLSVGVVLFPEDQTAFLQLENKFHQNGLTNELNMSPQGKQADNQWIILDNPNLETSFEFTENRKLLVQNIYEFKQFIEQVNQEETMDSLRLEQGLLHDNQQIFSQIDGENLTQNELDQLKNHLDKIQPFVTSRDEFPPILLEAENQSSLEDQSSEQEVDFSVYLNGRLPKHPSFRFQWFANDDSIWLDNNFAGINTDMPGYYGNTDTYLIEENPAQKQWIRFKGKSLITNNLLELRRAFEDIMRQDGDYFELEKALFLGTKKRNAYAGGGTISYKSVEEYVRYLAYLENPDRTSYTEIPHFQFKENPYIDLALIKIPEDNVTLLSFQTDFKKLASDTNTIHYEEAQDNLQGFSLDVIYAIKENPEMTMDLEVQQFRIIEVPNLAEFEQKLYLLSNGDTEFSKHLERELLLQTDSHHSHSLGKRISEEDYQKHIDHLQELFLHQEQTLGFMSKLDDFSLEQKPTHFDSTWKVLLDRDAYEVQDGRTFLTVANSAIQSQEIDLYEVGTGLYLYRFKNEESVDNFDEYWHWEELDLTEYYIYPYEEFLSIYELESGSLVERAVHLQEIDGELFFRPINIEPEKYKVINGHIEMIETDYEQVSESDNETISSNELSEHQEETIDTDEIKEVSLFDFPIEEESSEVTTSLQSMTDVPINGNFFPESFQSYASTKREKAKDNLAALQLLDELTKTKQQATPDQQLILSRYSGWGGIPEIFDEQNSSWQEERVQLKSMISESEYQSARASVLTAFYTDPHLIQSMYQFAEHFGNFSQGRILDPAMGTGNFFQALPDKWQKAQLMGIELESLTGRLAKQLYPDATIKVQGFEKVESKEKVDLVIGNFPFNNIKVLDKKYDRYNFVVHDYFMAKSIDNLETEGLLLFMTSSGSMDKKDKKAREYLAKRAHLIGAIRLPKTAFKQSAGTEVISDILIFQKKTYQEMVATFTEPDWLQSVEHPEHEGLFINQYFLDHPEYILGTIQVKNFHGKTIDVVPFEEHSLVEQVNVAFDTILETSPITRKDIKRKAPVLEPLKVTEIIVPENTEKYSYFMVGNRTFYHTIDGEYEEITGKTTVDRIKYMVPVKQAVAELLSLQQNYYEEHELEEKLNNLNKHYDTFVERVGYFNDRNVMTTLREDLKFPLLLSLEKETETGYEKQPIFYQATVRPKEVIKEVLNASEAVRFSMTKMRKIDFDYIQSVYPNHSIREILQELGQEIYLNPEKIHRLDLPPEEYPNAWEVADEYLTGNVRSKLDHAVAIQKAITNEELVTLIQENITSLKQSQPERLLAGDIQFQIGSPWIPVEIYDAFMHTLFQTPSYLKNRSSGIKVDFLDHNASWRILQKNLNKHSVIVNQTYGTDRITGYEILEASLNLQQVTIKDREQDGDKIRYVLNPEETMVARGKQEDIEYEFQKWLFADQERANLLLDIYNRRFNTTVPRKYHGDDLTFDEMNVQMELRPHQKDVIARILYSGRALMAHEVGAGKTAAMLSAGMYLKQNGLINKPLYVVPNHLTEQWGKEILTFYPTANILITTKKDFQKRNRQAFVSKIATGDYDAIIIGHSQFERIPLSKERQRETIEMQIDDTTRIVQELKEANAENWTVKQMERFRSNLETTLEKLDNDSKRDEVITFEDLGVDFLFVDEAHVYKNLFIYTKMQNVAGVGNARSQRASDMLGKVRYIQDEYDGSNVVFATGTPVSNSMSELYVMQYFLQPEALRHRGLNSFDSWAATFGQVVSSLEITPEGSGYRMRNRFSKFHNLPELMSMFYEVADIQTAEMLQLPVPELETGKVQTIVTKRTPFQEEMMDEFVIRSEAIRNNQVDPTEDNMLKLTNEAKLMAIDGRLLEDSLEYDPESKLGTCAEKVFSIWDQTKDTQSTQIIFSDSGTPKIDQFNVYDEMKEQLMNKGIPKEQIAFIHDAKTDLQRDTMFDKVRKGDIRVILGSTQKLGTGTNIQDKLIAAHHIDCPWKPSDLTQREGRILRQGNENEMVSIYRYVTKGTFDSYLWQIQEQKLTYISQVMSGNNINRSMEDLDDTVLTAAEVKAVATDNPLLAKKMTVDNEVSRLQILRSQWSNSQSRMDQNIRETYPNKIQYFEQHIVNYGKDLSVLKQYESDDFRITLNGQLFNDRTKAFEQIHALSLLQPLDVATNHQTPLGNYRGLEVLLEKGMREDNLVLKGELSYRTPFRPESITGNITRLMNIEKRIEDSLKETKSKKADTELQLESAKKEIKQPFSQQEELDRLLKEQRELNAEIELDTLKKEAERTSTTEEQEVAMGM